MVKQHQADFWVSVRVSSAEEIGIQESARLVCYEHKARCLALGRQHNGIHEIYTSLFPADCDLTQNSKNV